MGGEAVGEFRPIVRLDALYGEGERFHQMVRKYGRRIGAVFLKSLNKMPSGILINSGILEEMLSNDLTVYETGGRDKFHIYLNVLSGMVHLLVRLGNILRIVKVESHDTVLFEEMAESRNGAGIAALHELNPENHKVGVGVSPVHMHDQFDFIRGMLVRVMVRSSGAVAQGVNRAVITSFLAVNILPVGFVFNGGFGNTVFVRIFNK